MPKIKNIKTIILLIIFVSLLSCTPKSGEKTADDLLPENEIIQLSNTDKIEMRFNAMNNITDIGNTIKGHYNNFRAHDADSIGGYLALNYIYEDFSVTGKRSIPGFAGALDDLECYDVSAGELKLTIVANEKAINNENKIRYLTLTAEIKLNENNFMHLFPYGSISGYINDSNFGNISIQENDELIYMLEYDTFRLKFNNNILDSFMFVAFIP